MKLNYQTRFRIAAFFAVVPFFVWLYRFINLDFFYDEMYTLIHYVLVPIKKTVFIYQNVNNHFLSNLFNNIYLKLVGEQILFSLIDHPWVIRILQFIYIIITLVVFYRLCEKFFNKRIALFSLILLSTSIPYYNYVLQVRGYNLSIMLLCILLYYLWNFEQQHQLKDGFLFAGSSALFIYSMPSNAYTLLGIGFYYFIEGCSKYFLKYVKKNSKTVETKKNKDKPERKKAFLSENRDAAIIIYLVFGVLLSVLFLSPLIPKMMQDPQLKTESFFYTPTLYAMMPSVFYAFISWRYLILPLAVAGLIYFIIKFKKSDLEFLRKVLFCLLVLIVPFIVSFIRGGHPFDRFFLNLISIFCLLISLCMSFLCTGITDKRFLYISIILLLYVNLTFAFGLKHINRKLKNDIEYGYVSVSLLYNYFQAHYAPKELLQNFTQNYPLKTIPIVLDYIDRAAFPAYITKFQKKDSDKDNFFWTFADKKKWGEILTLYDSVYVITAIPNKFNEWYFKNFSGYESKIINNPLQYHNIMLYHKSE